ncbi:CDP-glycerol glycerophosphotransferase family protein [Marinobacter lipolyticus]|uniref:CDP-glycerol glycerophosphotransferase family protein n=1 Tax=Marinobacter lipolyticus TaxID=209639 RepID=UPI003A903196
MPKAITSSFRAVIVKVMPPFVKKPIKKCLSLAVHLKVFPKKVYMALVLPLKHERLLTKAKGAEPIRVLFVASSFASWKVDQVVAAMRTGSRFETTVLLGRLSNRMGEAIAADEHRKLSSHFKNKGFDVVDTFNMDDAEIRETIRQIDPHVVFITNPHSLITKALHQEILSQRLTCYVPYHHEVVAYGNNREQYDQLSHNALWKVFAPHQTSRSYYRKIRMKGDKGVVVTGLPACEPLFERSRRFYYHWKSQAGDKLRIIWAPHWLIRPDLKLATIYELGDAMKDLAWRYRDKVEWVMRPHPFLKPTMVNHPGWGKDKTDEFFKFWTESDFAQIEEGDYIDLFQTSDAMIHDSGSFLAEYLCVDKPVMYLKTETTAENYLNEFGQLALNACEIGRSIADIEWFINRLLAGEDPNKDKRKTFINETLMPLYAEPPSQKICQELIGDFASTTEQSVQKVHR